MSASNVKNVNKKNKIKYPKMDKQKLNKFIELLSIPSSSNNEKMMDDYITRWLDSKDYSYNIDLTGNIIVSKGCEEYKPCIVSHIDTVHDIKTYYNKIVQSKDKKDGHTILSSPQGIGGDDKCGIFACMEMLDHFNNINCVFFTKEETGQIGSNGIDLIEFDDSGYILQLDRWGANDFIDMYWGSKSTSVEFDHVFSPLGYRYGYSSNEGLITDSMVLFERNVNLSCVNISCGYYQHHTINEYIDTNIFQNSLNFTRDLITKLGNKKYECWNIDQWEQWDDKEKNCKQCGFLLLPHEKDYCEYCDYEKGYKV